MPGTRWHGSVTLEALQEIGKRTAAESCGIRFTDFGDDWLEATLPLDDRTRDASGALHPGAMAILAESIGSVAANLSVDGSRQRCVGQLLHVNHPGPITVGPLRARTSMAALLADSQVWSIDILGPAGDRLCVARLTMAVLDQETHG